MRLVFMGTPEFAVPVLDRLARSEHEVVAVYTQPDRPAGRGRGPVVSPVKKAALDYGLSLWQPSSLRRPEAVEGLAAMRPDVIVVAAFGQLLPRSVLDIPAFGCLNVHPSLLPKHRGASPVAAAILAGDEVTGVSIMLMDEGFDTGPVLAQEQAPISPDDTTGSLAGKLAEIGAELLMQTLPLWLEGRLKPQPQIEAEATYSRTITKKDGDIDWRLSAVELWRRVRAFQPWPGCYTKWQGKLLKIVRAAPLAGEQAGEPGRVTAVKKGESSFVAVQTGDGLLELGEVQLEGKRVMSAAEFVRGQRGFLGSVLAG